MSGSVLRRFNRRRESQLLKDEVGPSDKEITAGQPVTKQTVKASKQGLKPDNRFMEPLLDLRDHCENINKRPSIVVSDGVYVKRNLGKIEIVHVDGVEIGYGLEELPNGRILRKIFVKIPGYRIDEIPEEQREPILAAIFEVFIDKGQGEVVINQIADDAMLIAQEFLPMIAVELNPNLISKGPPPGGWPELGGE